MIQAAVTLADLEAWRASAQAVVAKTMSSVQARILGCMGRLQQQLTTELAARQAAAAAEKQVWWAVLLSRCRESLAAGKAVHNLRA